MIREFLLKKSNLLNHYKIHNLPRQSHVFYKHLLNLKEQIEFSTLWNSSEYLYCWCCCGSNLQSSWRRSAPSEHGVVEPLDVAIIADDRVRFDAQSHQQRCARPHAAA
jgi:hypothetical protein